ncbi:tRNA1(Val) (adenine(37)-N6)-methyltransferase [Thermovibrio sp.]
MESKRDLSTFLNNKVKFYQLKEGFRFGTDTFLLTTFVKVKGRQKLIDLGTGCGVIPILLLLKHRDLQGAGIDIVKENVETARLNAELNKVSDRFKVFHLDVKRVKELFKAQEFDIVVSNPPFIEKGRGSLAKGDYRQTARQETTATLEDFIKAAKYLLKNKGRFYLLLPTSRFVDAVSLLREKGLEPKRLRFIYPERNKRANLFLIESVKGGGKGIEVLPPLVVYENSKERKYTEEVEGLYNNFLP